MKIETVAYQINWRKFYKGRSIFIPCIDTKAARREVARVMRRLKVETVDKVVVEDGIKGLRIWRI